MSRIVSFADGFSSVTAPEDTSNQEWYEIKNGVVSELVTSFVGSAFMYYELKRKNTITVDDEDVEVEYSQTGSIIINEKKGVYKLSFGNYTGDEIIVDEIVNDYGVKFTMNEATGELYYDSGSMIVTDYLGTLKLSNVRIL